MSILKEKEGKSQSEKTKIICCACGCTLYIILSINEILHPFFYNHIFKNDIHVLTMIFGRIASFIFTGMLSITICYEVLFLLKEYKRFFQTLKKVARISSLLLILFTSILIYPKMINHFNYEKVSKSDYQAIENIIETVTKKEDLFLYSSSFMKKRDNTIEANFEGDDCNIKVKYDEKFEVIEKEYEDDRGSYLSVLSMFIFVELGIASIFIFICNRMISLCLKLFSKKS
ncbi:MAG: hypothetical protein Q4D02_02160 [Clostridia bacterium]|nr:hypothetical protein [Clostridia bacterium]